MMISKAIDGLSKEELKSSEVYLRAALATVELEARLFFIEMAKEELKHARTLLEMAPHVKGGAFDLAVTRGDLEAVGRTVDVALRAVRKAKGKDQLFTALLRMEKGEMNSIYESVLHLYTNQLLPRLGVETFRHSTEKHLAMLRQAGERFGLGPGLRRELSELRVKALDYYKNIT